MNLAFLIGFMTFHFYLNLSFHANISTISILIVIYFNFSGSAIIPHIKPEHYQKGALQSNFFNFNLF